MADQYPKDSLNYFNLFQKQWNYINKYIIDHEHGEWYMGGLDKEPDMKTAQKGQIWKASYHQFRALSNIVQRLRPDKTAPAVPKNVKSSLAGNSIVLKWEKATDNQNLLAYNLYQNRKRIAFTPLTSFAITNTGKLKGSKVTVKAVDYQGNLSAVSNAVTL